MAKRDRATLKRNFEQGEKPSQQSFEDLIDSTLNMLDDGFNGSPHIGIGLTPLTDRGVFISTYGSPGDTTPLWEFAIDKNSKDLKIQQAGNKSSQPAFIIEHVGNPSSHENQKTPQNTFFNGMVHCKGINGNYNFEKELPADKGWLDLLESEYLEEGSFALRIVAGYMDLKRKKYIFLIADALHFYGDVYKIKKIHSYSNDCWPWNGWPWNKLPSWLSPNWFTSRVPWRHRLYLCWEKDEYSSACRLQIRVSGWKKRRRGFTINCQVTRLWHNSLRCGSHE